MNELLDRLVPVLPYLLSPRDGSPLSLDRAEGVLVDGGGHRYPVVEGTPVLLPGLEALLAGHYELSAAAPPHALYERPVAEVLRRLASGPVAAWFLGFPFEVHAAHALPGAAGAPGTLFETAEGKPAIAVAGGAIAVDRFRSEFRGEAVETWRALRDALPVDPPFRLVERAMPSVDFSNWFEILHALDRVPADPPGPIAPGRLEETNLPFFRHLAAEFGLDLGAGACLDVGCNAGFLVSVFERLGARIPLGLDLRWEQVRGFARRYPRTSRGVLALADLFEWSAPPGSCTLVAIRNNSAFCMTDAFDDRFVRFGRRLLEALAPGGLAHLSFVSDQSRVRSPQGFTNLPVDDVLRWAAEVGAAVLRLARLGSMTGFLLARPEDEAAHRERSRRPRAEQRRAAFDAYRSGDALRVWFLAVSDFVSEIAQECLARGRPSVSLWGTGILGYHVWRLLGVSFPQIAVRGFAVAGRREGPSAVLVLPAEEADLAWRDDTLRVLVDVHTYERRDPEASPYWTWRPEALLFDPRGAAEAPEPPLEFHYLSGDHDLDLPADIAGWYLQGRLARLGPRTDPDAAIEFERLGEDFPMRFRGVY